MSFGWTARPSGLNVREDEFSWQGSCDNDPHFFLRREKQQTSCISDLIFGSLDDAQVGALLADFLNWSGGLGEQRLSFLAIASNDAPQAQVDAVRDRILAVVGLGAESASFTVASYSLELVRGKWDLDVAGCA